MPVIFLFMYLRLLIVTPSNSAADLVAERLVDSGRLRASDMVRLIAYQVCKFKPVVYACASVYRNLNRVYLISSIICTLLFLLEI